MSKIKASIIGVTGFTGTELLRVLLGHPEVEIKHLISRRHDGKAVGDVFPRLAHVEGLTVTNTDPETVAKESDVVFLCLPHETSQDVAPKLLGKTKIIDLSADFRLKDAGVYARYYSGAHKCPDLLDGRFVYGLPEIYREEIIKADAVANPGCYALLTQVLLYPFKGQIDHARVVAVSGYSGAGRKAVDPTEHPALSQNMKSYLVNAHRHLPEILGTLELEEEKLDFVPTVGPYLRGIFATAFISPSPNPLPTGERAYIGAPFVRMVNTVELTNIVGTNYIDLHYREGRDGIIAQGALDNLLKGASGCAVQNMNLMFGLPETTGLDFSTPLYP